MISFHQSFIERSKQAQSQDRILRRSRFHSTLPIVLTIQGYLRE